MKKIAICLSGEARSLELTKPFYETICKLEEYDVSFFITTWTSNFDNKIQSFKNLKKHGIFKEEDYLKQTTFTKTSNNYKYSFLLKACNLLKQQYELENNINFDSVIISRLDTILHYPEDMFSQYFNVIDNINYSPLVTFTADSLRYNSDHRFLDDNFLMTNSITSDLYSNIHFTYFGHKMNRRRHSLETNAFIVQYYNILNHPNFGTYTIIRPYSVHNWLRTFTEVPISKDNTIHYFKSLGRSVNNTRVQTSIKNCALIIDLRNKNYIYDKIGYGTFLELYLDSLAIRFRDTTVVLLVDKNKKQGILDLNLHSRGKQRKFSIYENRSLKEVLLEEKQEYYYLTTPTKFLDFNHNFFYLDCPKNDISYFTQNNKSLNFTIIIKDTVKSKLLEYPFEYIEDIDLDKFSSTFDKVQRHEIKKATDLNKVRKTYETFNESIYI